MKKAIKQVKKGFAALLAAVLVVGAGLIAPTAVYADSNARIADVVEWYEDYYWTWDERRITISGFRVALSNDAPLYIVFPADVVLVMAGGEYNLTIPVGTTVYFMAVHMMTEPDIKVVEPGREVDVSEFWWHIQSPGGWVTYTFNTIGDGVLNLNWRFHPEDIEEFNFPAGEHSVSFTFTVVDEATPTTEAQPPPRANDGVTVTVNGTAVNFADQQPTIIDGRTLVPVRGVFETLGFEVSWNPDLRQATLARANDTIVITIDSATFTANGASRTLDVPAQIIGGSTMIPIRAVLEAVGYSFSWDGVLQTVMITAAPADAAAAPPAVPMGQAGDPGITELIGQLGDRGIEIDGMVDGRPVFRLTPTERTSVITHLGERALTDRIPFFGTLGYMRDLDGGTVFLIYSIDD